jgi:L-seryl-tRNA(Ser) seleniumtransferase
MKTTQRPAIPQVEKLVSSEKLALWISLISRPLVIAIVREKLEQLRNIWQKTGELPDESEMIEQVVTACKRQYRCRPIRVINCSGVLIHTNLGRAPLDQRVWNAVQAANTHYTALEYSLEKGTRGQRNALFSPLFATLTGSEGAVVVNNNAAAIFLILSTFAKGKEVIVSRGELVQIGGGFRIPDILEQSGATLVPVGTTNITTCDDYLEAITEQTAMVLKVHRSNFAVRGFTEEPSTAQLVAALPKEIMLVVDQGSGVIQSATVPGETSVTEHIHAGASLVSFSGDKVLGSVQSGCIVGKRDFLTPLERHPLYRVLRPGKTVATILEQTLIYQLNGELSTPLHMAKRSHKELKAIGEHIIEDLPSDNVSLVEAPMTLGGGSAPDEYIPGIAIKLMTEISAEQMIKLLRDCDIPIIGKIEHDSVLLHLGSVDEEEADIIRTELKQLLKT